MASLLLSVFIVGVSHAEEDHRLDGERLFGFSSAIAQEAFHLQSAFRREGFVEDTIRATLNDILGSRTGCTSRGLSDAEHFELFFDEFILKTLFYQGRNIKFAWELAYFDDLSERDDPYSNEVEQLLASSSSAAVGHFYHSVSLAEGLMNEIRDRVMQMADLGVFVQRDGETGLMLRDCKILP